MSTHEDLVGRIRFAINDPGAFVRRKFDERGGPAESVGAWGARAVVAALTQSQRSERGGGKVPYDFLFGWIQSEIEGWSRRADTMGRRYPEYHGPTDLANQIVAGVLPMLVRRDMLIGEAKDEAELVGHRIGRPPSSTLLEAVTQLDHHAKSMETKLAKLREEHRRVHGTGGDCSGKGDCPGGHDMSWSGEDAVCLTCTTSHGDYMPQPCPVRRVLDA